LPLFLGGETKSKSAQAFANYEKAKADYQVAYDRVITDLRKQYDLVQSGWKKIQALQSAQESSELLVKAMRKSVQRGERINLDILLAQKGLFLTSRDLSQAKYSYLIAYLKLFQLGGSLDPMDFNQVALYFKK
jgi:protease secretion system outer membrane protein